MPHGACKKGYFCTDSLVLLPEHEKGSPAKESDPLAWIALVATLSSYGRQTEPSRRGKGLLRSRFDPPVIID